MHNPSLTPSTVVVPPRNLSREAKLWYTLVSPEYLDRSRYQIQLCREALAQEVAQSQDRLGKRSLPPGHWVSMVNWLIDSYPQARALLVHDHFQEARIWASDLSAKPRDIQEMDAYCLQGGEYQLFLQALEKAASFASDFLRATSMSKLYSADKYKDGTGDWRHDIPEDMGIDGWFIFLYEDKVFPIPPVEIWEYAADTSVSCRTGEIVPWTGVWVPSQGMGAAALAFARQQIQIMQPAYEVVKLYPDTSSIVEQYDLVECTWHPVKPTGRMIPNPALLFPIGHI